MNLGLFRRGNILDNIVQLFSSLDVGLSNDSNVLNLRLDDSDVFGDSLDVRLQLFGMFSQRFDLGGDVGLLGGEIFLLVLDLFGDLFFDSDGSLINFFTGIDTLVSLTLEFFGELILNIFNLVVDVGDLLLNMSSLCGNDVFSDSLGLNLLLNEGDSLISLFGDSFRSLFLDLRFVDLGSLLVDDVLGSLIFDDLGGLLTQILLFGPFLVLDVLVFDF